MDHLDGSKVVLAIPPSTRKPAWKDLARCMKCQQAFNLIRRHHHCRHCGGDFCDSCTPKEITIPKFGFVVSRVRVCDPCYAIVEQENAGFVPTLKVNQQSKQIEKAPKWVDGTQCSNCSLVFTTTNRAHHCRHCGQVFCGPCSSKESPIPKFGHFVEKVRVCEKCYDDLHKSGEASITVVLAQPAQID